MVAIFTGLGSGLENGSGSALGAGGLLGQSSLGRAGEQLFFNAANGNLVVSQRDEFVVGRGTDINIARTYNSQGGFDGDNGDNWRQSTTRRIFDYTGNTSTWTGGSLKRQGADGAITTYNWSASRGLYVATDGAGAHDTIERSGSYWLKLDGDSKAREYYLGYGADNWRIRFDRNADNVGTRFYYGNDWEGSKLSKVRTNYTGSYSSEVSYIWSGSNITKITTSYKDLANGGSAETLTRTYYTYDSANRLKTVTTDLTPENNSVSDGDTYVTSYTYHGTSNLIASISQTDGSRVEIAYDDQGRVVRLNQAVSGGDMRVTAMAYRDGYTVVTAPGGEQTRLFYDAKNQLTRVDAPPAKEGDPIQSVRYTYDSSGNVTKVETGTLPNTANLFDAPGWAPAAPSGRGGNLVLDDGWPNDVDGPLPAAGTPVDGWSGSYVDETEWTSTGGPYGQQVVSLHTGQTDTTADGGGAVTNAFTIDNTKAYEYTVYFKVDELNKHRVYFGLGGAAVKNAHDDAVNGNPYFTSVYPNANSGIEADKWYKMVGYVLPEGSENAPAGSLGGIYDTETGEKIQNLNAFKWNTGGPSNLAYLRFFNFYNESKQGLFTHYYKPEVREINAGALMGEADKLDLAADAQGIKAPVVDGWNNHSAYTRDGEARWSEIIGPDGAPMMVLEAGQFDATSDGGGVLATNTVNIDPSKTYKYTQYVHKSDLTKHYLYSGIVATGAGGAHAKETLSSGADGWASYYLGDTMSTQQASMEEGEWYKLVGYVLPSGSNLAPVGSYGGLYNVKTGVKVRDIHAFRWTSGVSDIKAYGRFFTYNDTANHGWSTQFGKPGFEVVSGLAADNADPFDISDTGFQATSTTSYMYDSRGNNTQVTDTNGDIVNHYYDAKNNLIKTFSNGSNQYYDNIGQYTRYAYDAENHLRYVVSPEGRVTEYCYHDTGELKYEIAYPETEPDPAHLIPASHLDISETIMDSWRDGLADRSSTQIRYHAIDARGNRVFTFDYNTVSSDGLLDWRGGYSRTYYSYDQAGQLLSRNGQGQKAETFVYDGMGRLIASSDAAGGVTTTRFDDAATTTIVRSAEGLITTSVYNKAGNLLSQTESAVGYTSGNLKPDLNANWVTFRSDRTAATAVDGNPAYKITTSAGQTNGGTYASLGAVKAGETVTYEITMKAVGDTTQHLIALSGSVDSWGHPVNSPSQAIVVNGPGRLEQSNSGYWYISGLSETIATTVTVQRTYQNDQNAYAYLYVGHPTGTAGDAVILSNPQITKTVTNTTLDLQGTDDYIYDKNGRLRLMTDDSGRRVFYFYDDLGRTIGEVESYGTSGNLTEYRYDDQGNVAATLRYASRIQPDVMATLLDSQGQPTDAQIDTIRPATHAYDITEYSVYDANGRLIQSIDGSGAVASYSYDKSDRLVSTRSYKNKLSAGTMNALKLNPPEAPVNITASSQDAIIRTFYDRDGNIVGALDADGYLSEIKYDKAGQKIWEVRFFYLTTASLRASGSFSQLYASVAGQTSRDIYTRYVYNNQGQLSYQIDDLYRVTEYRYNYAGKQTMAIEHAVALPTNHDYTYDNVKALLAPQAGNAANRESRFIYDTDGRLAHTIDPAGSVASFNYDAEGRVVKTIQYADLRTQASVPSFNTMQTWADANADDAGNRITRTYYNARGQEQFTIDAEGYVTENSYDNDGRLLWSQRWSNPYNATDAITTGQLAGINKGTYVRTSYTYDGSGRLNSVYNGEGDRTVYSYWPTGKKAWVYSGYGTPDQNQTYMVYDGAGRLTYEARAHGTPERVNISYAYDGLGNMTSMTDANGNVTSYLYNNRGQMVRETNAEGGVTRYEYDSFGNVVKTTDPNGNASYNYYDGLGRLVRTRDAEDYITVTRYTHFGEVESVTRYATPTTAAVSTVTHPGVSTSSSDATTRFEYDKLGRVTKVTDAEGQYEQYTLDAFGNRVSVRNKLGGTVTNSYDKRGLLLSETLPMKSHDKDGAVLASVVTNRFEYDARGNRTKMLEADNISADRRITEYVYDKANRLIETKGEAFGAYTISASGTASSVSVTPKETIKYDKRGNVIETKDAAGARTLFYYDDLNRKIVEINAEGTYSKFTYDKNGNVKTSRVFESTVALPSAAGGTPPSQPGSLSRMTSFTYDKLNRMTASTVSGLDAAGNIARIRTITWTGAAHSHSLEAITTRYEYDANGNVVKTTDANGNSTYSYYDNLNRKKAQVDQERYRTDWTYDAEGNVTRERRYVNKAAAPSVSANPPSVSANGNQDRITDYTYDKVGNRLSEARAKVQAHNGNGAHGTAAPATISYLYNGLGQLTQKTHATGDVVKYQYDQTGRLTKEYVNTAIGTTTGGSQSSQPPATQYYYNGLNDLARTRQGSVSVSSADHITEYNYSSANQLTLVKDASGFERVYRYDAAGRKVLETYQRATNSSAVWNGIGTRYDALGRQTHQFVLTYAGGWAKASGSDSTNIEYNAYGEVSRQGINGIWQQSFEYDGAGRVIKTNSGDGIWKHFGYDKNGNQTVAITSAGRDLSGKTFLQALSEAGRADVNVTYTQYDKRGQAYKVTEEGRQLDSSAGHMLKTWRSYNAFGETASETNRLDAGASQAVKDKNTTDYTYNTMGRLIQKESPEVSVTAENGAVSNMPPVTHYYYDASGRMTGSKDANGNLTTLKLLAGTGYDGAQALVYEEKHADGGIKKTQYDRYGNAVKVTDEIGRITNQVFDKMGRVTKITKPGGLETNYSYDGLGQRLTEWNDVLGGGNKQTTDYDAQGRVISTRAFGGDVTTTTYAWSNSLATTGLGTFGGWTQVTTHANGKTLTEKTDLFGRQTYKNDLGSATTNYGYDTAGRVISQTNTRGENLSFTYYNTGLQSGQTGTNGTLTYKYDKVGNRTYEKLVRSGQTLKNATIAFDALGRMTSYVQAHNSASPGINIAYTYDAHGNVRSTTTIRALLDQNGNATAGTTPFTKWNRFDAMNRLVVAEGTLSGTAGAAGTTIVRGSEGTSHLYNEAGQRTRSTKGGQSMSRLLWRHQWAGQTHLADNRAAIEQMYYDYDGLGTMSSYTHYFTGDRIELYEYDDAGQLERVKMAQSSIHAPTPVIHLSVTAPVASQASVIATYDYDNMGRLIDQQDKDGGSTVYHRQVSYDNAKNRISSETIISLQAAGTFKAVTSYDYDGLSNNQYALGQAVVVNTDNYKLNSGWTIESRTRTTNDYEWRDGAIQDRTIYDPDRTGGSTTHISDFNYNASGHLTHVSINDGDPRTVTYKNDETGQILQRKETGSNEPGNVRDIYTRYGSAQLGHIGNHGTLNTSYTDSILNRTEGEAANNFQFTRTEVNTPASTFGQANDQINSYSAGTSNSSYTVRGGESLQSIAQGIWGDANLWYKIAEANGLSGGEPLAAGRMLHIPHNIQRSSFHADTFKTYNAADAIGDTAPTTPQPPKKNKCAVVGQIFLVVIAVAVTALTAGTLGPVGAATLGNVASQGLGVATGIQSKFSFKQLGLTALTAGVTQGLGKLGSIHKGLSGVSNFLKADTLISNVARGAASNAITQGIGTITGLQDRFSFAGVAAAGVVHGIGGEISRNIGGAAVFNAAGELTQSASVTNQLVSGAAGAIAGAATRSAMTGTSFGDNVMRALPDVIGSTLGRVASEAIGGTGRASGKLANGAEDTKGLGLTSHNRTLAASLGLAGPQVHFNGADGGYDSSDDIVIRATKMTEAQKQAYDANLGMFDRIGMALSSDSTLGLIVTQIVAPGRTPNFTQRDYAAVGRGTRDFGRETWEGVQAIGALVSPIPSQQKFEVAAGLANSVRSAGGYAADVVTLRRSPLTDAKAIAGNVVTGVQNFRAMDAASQREALLYHGTKFGLGTATAALPGGAFTRGGVVARPVAGRVENVTFTNAKDALQSVTDRAVMDLASDPSIARSLMSEGSYAHLSGRTNLAHASYGKAVERLAARYIDADPVLGDFLDYQSRPFKSTPDFFGYEGYNMRMLDITTSKSVGSHLGRSYGPYTDYVLHPGLPSNLVFPK